MCIWQVWHGEAARERINLVLVLGSLGERLRRLGETETAEKAGRLPWCIIHDPPVLPWEALVSPVYGPRVVFVSYDEPICVRSTSLTHHADSLLAGAWGAAVVQTLVS